MTPLSPRLRTQIVQTDIMSPPPNLLRNINKDSFDKEVDDVVNHSSFPLIIKKVFEVCGSNAFDRFRLTTRFPDMESVLHFQENGNAAAETQCPFDTFPIYTVVAALNHANAVASSDQHQKLPLLQSALATGRQALSNIRTDPRYVGATDSRRVEGVHRMEPIPSSERIQHADTRHGIDAVRRSDGIHPSGGIQKSARSTRTRVSDKAVYTLERWFWDHFEDPFPTIQQKRHIAAEGGVSLSFINNWFGNKRMRLKRALQHVESPEGEPEGEYILDKALSPRAKWKALVLSKMKTQAGRDIIARVKARGLRLEENFEIDREGHSIQAQEQVRPSGPGRPRNIAVLS